MNFDNNSPDLKSLGINKDSHHTRKYELQEAVHRLFSGERPNATAVFNEFAQHAFVHKSGHVRNAHGKNIRLHLNNLRMSDKTTVEVAGLLTERNVSAIVSQILSDEKARLAFVQSFPLHVANALSNEQLTLVSRHIIHDLYVSEKDPEKRAEIIVSCLGKRQTLEGLQNMFVTKAQQDSFHA